MNYIIAMDLDGTLLNSHAMISQKNMAAIELLKQRNDIIVIASGRTDDEIATITKVLHLDDYDNAYYIGYNGVQTTHVKTKKVINQMMIDWNDVKIIDNLLQRFGLNMHVFCKDNIFYSKGIVDVLPSVSESSIQKHHINIASFEGTLPVFKVLVFDLPEKLDEFQLKIPSEMFNQYQIFKSATRLVEFVHKEGSKGHALSYLAKYLNVPRSNVIAFGDEENDITMLQYAGIGIAMDNAKQNVKKVADEMTLSNDLDGISVSLYKHIFDKGGNYAI
jgi:Cof subfamily protein (haloacid dehalogenase superfamily)